ncbi:MAG: endonuclease/exonuclease/phosphatase family protein [Clostridia bacterium]|nr:endonuclease/exonuclease/phosphatase family protein [Clostridia bacterium]
MNEALTVVRNYIALIISAIVALFGCANLNMGGVSNAEPGTVRVMSFNIRCGEFEDRGEIVPRLIADYHPDSLGLQECTYDWFSYLRLFLHKDYGFVGIGRDTGDRSVKCGEMSLVLYRKDKYNLVDSGTFWLSETPDEVSLGWDGACNRICTWVVLENKETGEKYAHVNTHLDHVGPLARQNGVELVKEKALSYDIPTVVTGDFNFSKGSELYNSLVTGGLTDTQDMAEYTMTGKTYHGYNGGSEGEPIDFICVNSQITDVKTYKIIRDMYDGKYTSDHYPIFSDMVIG